MLTIQQPDKLVSTILGEQSPLNSQSWRFNDYVNTIPDGENFLYFNLLTQEILSIDKETKNEWDFGNFNAFQKDYLIKKWFLLPTDCNESSIFLQLRDTAKMVITAQNETYINNFVIFTTTYCNARCFYCFEQGRKQSSMTLKTAQDVVNFIVRSAKGNHVKIQWFGGEPLCNERVIHFISDALKEKNISFSSKITTNAYLFKKETIQIAKEKWNLRQVVVTLDGTENEYNRIKNYTNKDPNAFCRVIQNIKDLSENNISVIIRLNINMDNVDDISVLIEQLHGLFGQRKNIKIHPHALFEYDENGFAGTGDEILFERICSIENKLFDYGMLSISNVNSGANMFHCMANDNHSTTILPDGRLGRCDYYCDDMTWGTLSHPSTDKSIIEFFSPLPDYEDCLSCKYLPICHKLKNCPNCSLERCRVEKKYKENMVRHYAMEMNRRYMKKVKSIDL